MNRKKTNMLILVDDIHLGGGGERVAVNMANHFYEDGWSVEIVSFQSPKENYPFNLNREVNISYLRVHGNKLTQKIADWTRLRTFLKNRNDEVILAIGCHPSTILGFVNYKKGATIGTEHSHFYHAPKIWNVLREFAYKRLSAIAVLTSYDLPIVKRLNKNTVVIPNAISSFPKRHASMNIKNFIAIGRMDRFKQFDKLIDVFNIFSKRNKEWKLTIVGDGELKEMLQNKISSYNLNKRIELKPFTTHIENEYLNSSILVSTSNKEGLPMVMIEAQSYGLPIVSFDCKTGPKEIIIDGENGYLVELDNIDAMVNALIKIAEDDSLRNLMSLNAIRDSLRFSPDVVYKKWDKLFNSLIN